jgi:HTH-type transcriptional regulator / antitoxin HipB
LRTAAKWLIFPFGKKMPNAITTAAEFGAALVRARKGLSLTQRELALAIGVGERFIVDLEAGKPTAQLGKALAAAKAVGMTLVDTTEEAVERGARRP